MNWKKIGSAIAGAAVTAASVATVIVVTSKSKIPVPDVPVQKLSTVSKILKQRFF